MYADSQQICQTHDLITLQIGERQGPGAAHVRVDKYVSSYDRMPTKKKDVTNVANHEWLAGIRRCLSFLV
jgi:hypothetical protein